VDKQFVEATEKAINQVVSDYQNEPDRFWNERDVHWSLFYYLKQQRVFQRRYAAELIRAEFPTLGMYVKKEGRKSRGHFDLVILDPDSVAAVAKLNLKPWTDWDVYLPLVRVLIAIEVKTWVDRLRFDRTNWDIRKLMDLENKVGYPYFLNYVQLDWERTMMKDYYTKLRQYLSGKPKSKLKILCVPNEIAIQPSHMDKWISPEMPK
jgi:hypothetical protein